MSTTLFTDNGRKSQTAIEEDTLEKDQSRALRMERWRSRWRRTKRAFKLGFVFLILAILAWISRDHIFVTIRSGEALVVYYRLFGGTSHNQIGHEGLHIIAPWDQAYRYNTRTQTLIKQMTVLSRNGLEVKLDAQIRFHPIPEVLPYLHRRYGPDYVENIIVPQLTEAVQRVIGQFLPEELYSSETGASVNRIFEDAKRLIGGVYIQIEDIALFNIRLPEKVQNAIQNKAEAEQNALAHAYKVQQEQREAERKMIEAKSLQQYANAVSGIPRSVLVWKGIEATLELAKSPNSKIIVMGGKDNLPLMLGNVPDIGLEK